MSGYWGGYIKLPQNSLSIKQKLSVCYRIVKSAKKRQYPFAAS